MEDKSLQVENKVQPKETAGQDVGAQKGNLQSKGARNRLRNVIVRPTDLAALFLEQYIKAGDCVLDATAGNGHDTLLLAKLVGAEGKVYGFDIQKDALLRTEKLLSENGIDSVIVESAMGFSSNGCVKYDESSESLPVTQNEALPEKNASDPFDKSLPEKIVQESSTESLPEKGVSDSLSKTLLEETAHCSVAEVSMKANEPDPQQSSANVNLVCDSHENVKSYIKKELAGAVFNLGYLPGGDKSVATAGESSSRAVRAVLDLLAKGGIVVITVYSGHPQGHREKEMILSMTADLPQKQYHVAYTSLINQKGSPPEVIAIRKK